MCGALKISVGLLLIVIFSHAKAQGQLETVVQRGHSLAVRSVCFSPDGKFLASGSEDKTIKIWEFGSGRELITLNGHQSNVNQVLFTSDGQQLISASRDRHIYFWDINTGMVLKDFHYPDENIISIDLSSNNKLLAVGTTARVVRVIDLESDSILFSWKTNVGQYGAHVVFSDDDKKLVVGEDNRTAKIYDLVTGDLLKTVSEPQGMCGGCDTKVAFLTVDQIIKGSRRSPLAIRALTTGLQIEFVEESPERLHALKLSTDKSRMIVIDEDSAVMWNVNNRKQV